MKKILVIVILFLSFCKISYAEDIVNLPKDTSFGYKKLFKSLTGNYYKDHGMLIVNKKDAYAIERAKKHEINYTVIGFIARIFT